MKREKLILNLSCEDKTEKRDKDQLLKLILWQGSNQEYGFTPYGGSKIGLKTL